MQQLAQGNNGMRREGDNVLPVEICTATTKSTKTEVSVELAAEGRIKEKKAFVCFVQE